MRDVQATIDARKNDLVKEVLLHKQSARFGWLRLRHRNMPRRYRLRTIGYGHEGVCKVRHSPALRDWVALVSRRNAECSDENRSYLGHHPDWSRSVRYRSQQDRRRRGCAFVGCGWHQPMTLGIFLPLIVVC